MALKQEQSVEASNGSSVAGQNQGATGQGATGQGATGQGATGQCATSSQCATSQLAARFLNQGTFDSYAAALDELKGWASRSGYPLSALAAWLTVGSKVRVQLATRSYWKPLTPRGQARDALGHTEAVDDLLCLEFRRGYVEAHRFDELRRAHGDSSLSGAA
jgi:hypothetical protein